MSARELYEACLIEMNKDSAPNIMLEDFNHFANKAIYQYINKRYNIYDINLQTTDDIRVLKSTAFLKPTHTAYSDKFKNTGIEGLEDMMYMDATYTAELPDDYFHLLNCECFYKVKKSYKCYPAGRPWRAQATRLTADTWAEVTDNFWNKPTYKRPYYYIHNTNTSVDVPTNPLDKDSLHGTDNYVSNHTLDTDYQLDKYKIFLLHNLAEGLEEFISGFYHKYIKIDKFSFYYLPLVSDPDFPEIEPNQIYLVDAQYVNNEWLITFNTFEITEVCTINQLDEYGQIINKERKFFRNGKLTDSDNSILEDPFKIVDIQGFFDSTGPYPLKQSLVRYGNASKPLIEIRYGEDNSVFELVAIMVDYIKTPQHIRLTQELLDRTIDYSQILEFPDYVCQEILNELVHILQENISDLRLLTHPIVSLSIANPAQQLTNTAAAAAQ